MSEWRRFKLENLIQVKHGFAFPGKGITSSPTNNILVTPGNFYIGGGFKGEKFKYYNLEVPTDYILKGGDLVLTMTDLSKETDTLGYPAIIPHDSNGKKYLHNQRIGLVQIISNEIDLKFLYWRLRANDYHHFIKSTASGTTVMHTAPKRIVAFEFTGPLKYEQEAIADVLSSIDDKIDLLNRQNETLESMAQTLFRQWFVEEADDSWEITTIGNALHTVLGGTPKTSIPEYWNGDIPWINSGEVNRFRISEGSKYITELALKKSNTKLLPKGTTVIAITGATLGQISLLEIDTCANQSVIGIIPNQQIPYWYVYLWVNHVIGEIVMNETGGAQGHINKGDLNSTRLVIPSKAKLDDTRGRFDTMFEKVSLNILEIKSLTSMRDTLLPKLMSGEVRVKLD